MKKVFLIGCPIIALLALVGWRYSQKTAAAKQMASVGAARKNAAVNVVLAKAGPKAILQTLQAVGTVESPFAVQLAPKLTGKIVYLDVREGAAVTTGQTLVRIDPTETLGQVLQAKSALAQARSNLISAKYIQHPTDVNIESQIDQGKATYRSNQADYDQVKTNYDAQVHQAHAMVLDAQAKLAAAKANTYNAQASYGSATANLENAQSKLNRETTLYKQGFVAAQDVDDAIAAQKVATANVKVADGMVRAAKSAEISAEQQLKSSEDNESIVKKTGLTSIQAASEKVKLASAALKYSESTTSQKPAYRAQLEALQAAVDAAVGNLNQAQARLADCNLVSTIDGTVTKRSADPGSVVNAGNSILEIQYLKWLYVSTAVPVEYTGKVVVGTPVTLEFDGSPQLNCSGAVTDLNQAADPQNRQFLARIRIDNLKGQYRPGMYATVHFQISKTLNPIVVPLEAVKTSNAGLTTVITVDSTNTAHNVPVVVGEQDDQSVAIKDGISAGDRVVVLSYSTVRDKQKVVEGGLPRKGKGDPSTGSDKPPTSGKHRGKKQDPEASTLSVQGVKPSSGN